MYPDNPSKNTEVKVEWDKGERQKARNRINQRNYRRRKSEQQRENEKRRAQSASKSPSNVSTPNADFLTREIGQSSQDYGTARDSIYDPSMMTWSTGDTVNHPFSGPTRVPSQRSTKDANLTPAWSSVKTSSGTSPSVDTDQQVISQDWQHANSVGAQSALSGLPVTLPASTWSTESPRISPFPSLSNKTISASSRGKTTLHLAAQNGQSQSVRTLLFHGADPNLKDFEGNTALHLAAGNSCTEVIAQLIEGGADINAVDASGRTALHIGVETDNLDVINQLLAAGCDPNVQILEQ